MSFPIEPTGSVLPMHIGAMIRSMSSRLYPKVRSILSYPATVCGTCRPDFSSSSSTRLFASQTR